MDILDAIKPKTDQLNFDDLIGGRKMTIIVTEVRIKAGDQPVSIHFQGDNGKPYKPAKSMSRVLVLVWGPDARKYVGRSMTLYGDPEVRFGKDKVGGIRISHMSHITESITMSLTATKASRKPFTVHPLIEPAKEAASNKKNDSESFDNKENNTNSGPAKKETDFPIYGPDGSVLRHVENADQWVLWFSTNLIKVDTVEKLAALQVKNMPMYGTLTTKGFTDQVGAVKQLISERKDQLQPPETQGE